MLRLAVATLRKTGTIMVPLHLYTLYASPASQPKRRTLRNVWVVWGGEWGDIYAVQLGYNVMKRTKYFVSL